MGIFIWGIFRHQIEEYLSEGSWKIALLSGLRGKLRLGMLFHCLSWRKKGESWDASKKKHFKSSGFRHLHYKDSFWKYWVAWRIILVKCESITCHLWFKFHLGGKEINRIYFTGWYNLKGVCKTYWALVSKSLKLYTISLMGIVVTSLMGIGMI